MIDRATLEAHVSVETLILKIQMMWGVPIHVDWQIAACVSDEGSVFIVRLKQVTFLQCLTLNIEALAPSNRP